MNKIDLFFTIFGIIVVLIFAVLISYQVLKTPKMYHVTFYLSPDLYEVLDSLAGEDETVEEYVGRLCQEIAETEWYIKETQTEKESYGRSQKSPN